MVCGKFRYGSSGYNERRNYSDTDSVSSSIRSFIMNKRSLLLMITALSLAAVVFAQESEQTIEELYLQSTIKTQILRAEAASNDRELKMIALRDIEEMISDNTAQGNPELLSILSDLSSEGVTNILREDGFIINDFPEIRSEATRLLGRMNTEEAADQLSLVLLTDPEPMVMSEAILALSTIQLTDTTYRDRIFVESIFRQTAIEKDNNFAFNYLESVRNIVEREGVINNPSIIAEVAKLTDARNGYITSIQEKAMKLLRELKELY